MMQRPHFGMFSSSIAPGMILEVPVQLTTAIPPPEARDTAGINVCPGKDAVVDINALFHSGLPGGTLNPGSIDLDPSTDDIDTVIRNDTGKWSVDTDTGELIFTPDAQYNGAASIRYRAKDNYGDQWSNIATVTCNVLQVRADAGNDQQHCNDDSFTMSAGRPAAGYSGQWKLVSGSCVIKDVSNPAATVTGVAAGSAVRLRWVVSNGICADSSEVVLTNNKDIASLSVVTSGASCFENNDGKIAALPVGGTPPYIYSIDGWVSSQATPDFNGLGAALYIVSVRDANGCEINTTAVVDAPSELNVTASAVPVRCFGNKEGEIHAVTTGGTPPYAYSIDNWSSVAATPDFKGLEAGSYTLAVRDRNGCQQYRVVDVEQPPELQGKLEAVRDACAPGMTGAVYVGASGGSGAYKYAIPENGMANNNGMFNKLPVGSYNITIADDNNCTVDLGPVAIHVAPPLKLYLDKKRDIGCKGVDKGMAIVSVEGGAPPYQFQINGRALQSSGVFEKLDEGMYTASVTDKNSCSTALNFDIVVTGEQCRFFMPNSFSPNGDGRNDIFRPVSYGDVTGYCLRIFNRWGTLLFQSRDPGTGWDGTYKGLPQPAATYIWTMEYMDKHSEWIRRSGSCTLVK